jgi:hypothetical protein
VGMWSVLSVSKRLAHGEPALRWVDNANNNSTLQTKPSSQWNEGEEWGLHLCRWERGPDYTFASSISLLQQDTAEEWWGASKG